LPSDNYAFLKKLLAISFIIVFAFNIIGHYLVFRQMQETLREDVKERIKSHVPDNELSLVKIKAAEENDPNSGFKKTEDAEFRWQGTMFDIVRSEKHGDITWYYCISDKQETGLFTNLDKQVKDQCQQNGPNKQKTQLILNNMVKEALPESKPITLHPTDSSVIYSEYFLFYYSITVIIPTPPPKG
jgi:hypothetical protein